LGFAAAYAASKDFWNTKEPSEWTSSEVQQLLTKSPWARDADVTNFGRTMTNNRGGGMGGNRGGIGGLGGGMGGGVGGGIGGGLGGRNGNGGAQQPDDGMGGGNPTGGRRVSYQALVRWDSAMPMREALHTEPSEQLEKYYILNVLSDAPGLGGVSSRDRDDADADRLDRLKDFTKLDRKDHPIFLAKAEAAPSGSGMLFYFPRSEPISMDDKQMMFMTRIGQVDIKVRFTLKDMTYRGKLEL